MTTEQAWNILKNGVSDNAENAYSHDIENLKTATINKGEPLTRKEVKQLSKKINYSMYNNLYNVYYNEWLGEGAQAREDAYAVAQMEALSNKLNELYPSNDMTSLNDQGLNTTYQTYLDALNKASQEQYSIEMNALDAAENEMYRAIGLSQNQMEQDIAKRRQQALKSGMSTAQLAAQEQQNILAAQTGAMQIAQNFANQRYSTINQFAGTQSQNYADVLAQQTQASQNWANTMAQVYPQYYSAKQYSNENK